MKTWAYVALAMIIVPALGAASSALVTYGDGVCEQRHQDAATALATKADEKEAALRAADAARIAALEATVTDQQQQLKDRASVPAATPISDACDKCMVPRSWMRGEKVVAGETNAPKAAPKPAAKTTGGTKP